MTSSEFPLRFKSQLKVDLTFPNIKIVIPSERSEPRDLRSAVSRWWSIKLRPARCQLFRLCRAIFLRRSRGLGFGFLLIDVGLGDSHG